MASANQLFREVNHLSITCHDEVYVFIFGDDQVAEVLQRIARMAASPELSLTWFDAARLSKEVRDAFNAPIKQTNQPGQATQ